MRRQKAAVLARLPGDFKERPPLSLILYRRLGSKGLWCGIRFHRSGLTRDLLLDELINESYKIAIEKAPSPLPNPRGNGERKEVTQVTLGAFQRRDFTGSFGAVPTMDVQNDETDESLLVGRHRLAHDVCSGIDNPAQCRPFRDFLPDVAMLLGEGDQRLHPPGTRVGA